MSLNQCKSNFFTVQIQAVESNSQATKSRSELFPAIKT